MIAYGICVFFFIFGWLVICYKCLGRNRTYRRQYQMLGDLDDGISDSEEDSLLNNEVTELL